MGKENSHACFQGNFLGEMTFTISHTLRLHHVSRGSRKEAGRRHSCADAPGRSLFFFRMKSCMASLTLTNLVSLHTKQGGVCQQYYWKETRSGTLADAFFNLHTLLDTTKTFWFKSYLLSSWTDSIKKPLSLSVLPKELTRPEEILTTQAAVRLATHWNLWPQFFSMVWNLQFHESCFLHLVLKTRSLSKHLRCYHYTS